MKLTKRSTISIGVLAAIGGIGVAALSIGGGGLTATPSTSSGSVLTGKPGAAGDVLAVKIDNVSAARPQTGLNSADIVYAIQVEGGLSRFMAIYDSNHMPDTVGPVRSARQTDLQLLGQYNHPALAFSGAQSKLLPVLKGSDDIEAISGGSHFYRSSNRPAPHNEYLHPKGLGGSKAEDIGLRFGAAPNGGAVNTVRSAWRFQFVWTGDHYRINMDQQHSPLTTDNVIVQHVKVKQSDYHSRTGYVPYTQTVGEGSGVLMRNGKSYTITWERHDKGDGTTYKWHGKPVNLTPGRTWVVLK